jgi:hypothetical protein
LNAAYVIMFVLLIAGYYRRLRGQSWRRENERDDPLRFYPGDYLRG